MKANAIGILMFIDTIVYRFVDYLYDIFYTLAKVNIFSASDYRNIVKNIYVILGLIMMFALSYSLLKAVINPDEFSKGENSFPKLIKNVIVSLAIIAVLPTVFTFAFNFQNTVLNQDTIPKLLFDKGGDYELATRENAGEMMAYYVMSAFLHPNVDWCQENEYAMDDGKTVTGQDDPDINLSTCAKNINGDGDWLVTNGENLQSVTQKFKNPNSNYDISAFNDFGESAAKGKITYNAFVSTAAGVFLAIVLLNFCFDMALRVVKLMFYQIIAPIPVVCRVIPGGKFKDVFGDWMKKTISTYVDVFMRIAVMYLGVYMISLVVDNFPSVNLGAINNDIPKRMVAEALIIMGVVTFIRQAPKLIGDMFHLDTGGWKLGIMDKLAMGGALAAGSTLLSAGGMFGSNAVNAIKDFRATRGQNAGARIGAAIRGVGSTIAGTASGGVRGFRAGKNAKNLADVKNSARTSIDAATKKREERANMRYRAQSAVRNARGENRTGVLGAVETAATAGALHFWDNASKAGRYFGITSGFESLKEENDFLTEITNIDDNTDALTLKLLERDPISQSSALMSAASTDENGNVRYSMSYSAMNERMQLLRNTSFDSVAGRTLVDFQGNQVVINNENDYAQYASSMKAQLNEAERAVKRYIKTQGYRGADGVQELENLGITLGGGERQKMADLYQDRTKAETFVREHQAAIAGLNSTVDDPDHRIDAITDGQVAGITGAWEQMDQLITNAKERKIAIRAEYNRLSAENASNSSNKSGH